MYLKRQSDQTIKEIKLTEFNFNQNNNDVNIDINNHDRKFLTFNNLMQENNLTEKSNYLFKFDNLEQLKEVHRKLNIFDKSYKNNDGYSYYHSVNLSINKRFFNLDINSNETFIYYVKDGTKQEEIRTYERNKRGKLTDKYTSTFKTVDNMIQKQEKRVINENLLNVFSSNLSKDFIIDLHLRYDVFIQMIDLMVKNNFLEIRLSNSQKQFILHDNTNYIISAMTFK